MAEPIDPRYAKSAELQEQARLVLPGGVSSNARVHQTPFPLIWTRSHGPHLWDADGNRYVDHTLGNGSVILGHAHAGVNAAAAATLPDGQLYAGSHASESALAREICQMVPCAEMVTFGLSGSDAVHTALRVARAATKRPKVVKFEGHYHGWYDNVAASVLPIGGPPEAPIAMPISQGLPPGALADLVIVQWNEPDALTRAFEAAGGEIAAVLLEPVPFNLLLSCPVPGMLERARELCTRHGAILIFDEVVSGFRIGPGGAQAHYGVTPDLATFGKALANGFAISAVAGRRDLMSVIPGGGFIHAGTHNGNPLSVAAARATLAELRRDGGAVYRAMDEIGGLLMEGLRAAAHDAGMPLQLPGFAGMFETLFVDGPPVANMRAALRLNLPLQARFGARMQDRGVRLMRDRWLLSASHTRDEVDAALAAARETMAELRAG
jgi:glutamate-1-semialdehyde 2,1-aminomutase